MITWYDLEMSYYHNLTKFMFKHQTKKKKKLTSIGTNMDKKYQRPVEKQYQVKGLNITLPVFFF